MRVIKAMNKKGLYLKQVGLYRISVIPQLQYTAAETQITASYLHFTLYKLPIGFIGSED